MNFGEAMNIWRRRRLLTTALSLLALAAVAAAVVVLPRDYQAQASVVVLPSPSLSRPNGGNPYLSFTSSVTQAADIVSRVVMSPRTATRLAARGYTESYTVGLDPDPAAGPVIDIQVSGHDQAALESTLHAVTAQIATALGSLQGALRPSYRMRVVTLSSEPQAKLALTHTARPVIVLAIASLLFALGVPVLADGRQARPRIPRQASRRPRYADQAELSRP